MALPAQGTAPALKLRPLALAAAVAAASAAPAAAPAAAAVATEAAAGAATAGPATPRSLHPDLLSASHAAETWFVGVGMSWSSVM